MSNPISIIITGRVIALGLTKAGTNEDGTPKPRYTTILFKSLDSRITGTHESVIPIKDTKDDLVINAIISVKYTEKGYQYSTGTKAKKTGFYFAGTHGDITKAANNIKSLKTLNAAEDELIASFSFEGN